MKIRHAKTEFHGAVEVELGSRPGTVLGLRQTATG